MQKSLTSRLIRISLLLLTALTTARAAERPPNIIFFIADDMYEVMFNCLNQGEDSYLTPNIDRLAHEGTVMLNQHVASPVCTPSRYNCITGQYASRATNRQFREKTAEAGGQTVIQWNTFVTSGQPTLPRYLQELGYVTGMVGKNHMIEVPELYEFPDYEADPKAPEIAGHLRDNYEKVRQAVRGAGFDYAESLYHDNPNWIGLGQLAVQNMEWIADAGLRFIEEEAERPFFLYFATTIPHHPQQPERSWQADPLVTAQGYLDSAPQVMPARETLPQRVAAAGVKGPNAELVLWLDDALGALWDKLEEKGVLENTIIFFFNDHGQTGKGTLYEGGTRTPTIVWRHGGFAVGPACDAWVQNIDFAPTILEFAGGEPEGKDFDGHSMKRLLDGREVASDRTFYFELGYSRALVKDGFKYLAVRYPTEAEMLDRAGRQRVLEAYNETRRVHNLWVVNSDPMAPYSHFSLVPGGELAENESYGTRPGFFDRDQLYHLPSDPGETVNLADDPAFAPKLQELRDELLQQLGELPGSFAL